MNNVLCNISGGSRISQTGEGSAIPQGWGWGEGRKPMKKGAKDIIWQDFSRKLHENERNWIERRRFPGRRVRDQTRYTNMRISVMLCCDLVERNLPGTRRFHTN